MTRIYFCLRGSCSERITGNGSMTSVTSVVRLNPAITYQTVKELRHLPSTESSQNAATGMQIKVNRKAIMIVHAPTKAAPTAVIHCMTRPEKIRRYWKRIEILTRHMATLYSTMEL